MKIVQKVNNPKFLVITPLRVGDKISKPTKKSIKRNDVPFDWISYEGEYNIPTNTSLALQEYEENYSKLPFLIKIDNDVVTERGMLDDMYQALSIASDKKIAYTYAPFEFIMESGRRISFPYREFDERQLLRANYISSNSMIDRDALEYVGGFVTDSKYERLLDYALWLKFLYYGYIGKPIKKAFVAPMSENSVSARGQEDYKLKMERIREDFVKPILESESP